jgi:DNA adenine methylase
MQQILPFQETYGIVNVASVPKRSPFRYPGGKTWLVPRIRGWLNSLPTPPKLFIEPFTGGGIVGLTVAFERLAEHVLMVELDQQVAAVWQTILSEDAAWLANKIITFNLTPDSVKAVLEQEANTLQKQAFQTILRNRVNRGGILAPGAGMIKAGENGRGLASRWYPTTLQKRIHAIAAHRDSITFIHGDGLDVMQKYMYHPDAVCFIDPPYTAAGKKAGARLYSCNDINHEHLLTLASQMTGDVLLTYDNTEEVRVLAQRYGFDTQPIPMKNTHHTQMTELLIGRSLDWARSYKASAEHRST